VAVVVTIAAAPSMCRRRLARPPENHPDAPHPRRLRAAARWARNGTEHIDTVLRAIRWAAGGAHRQKRGVAAGKLAERLAGRPCRAPARAQSYVTATLGRRPAPKMGRRRLRGPHKRRLDRDKRAHGVRLTRAAAAVRFGVVVPGTGRCLNNFLYGPTSIPRAPNRVMKQWWTLTICWPPVVTQGTTDRCGGWALPAGGKHPANPGAGPSCSKSIRPPRSRRSSAARRG